MTAQTKRQAALGCVSLLLVGCGMGWYVHPGLGLAVVGMLLCVFLGIGLFAIRENQ